MLPVCRIKQLRLYDGQTVAHRHFFERLYVSQAGFANGKIKLESDDYNKIRAIYAVPDFLHHFGVPYSDDLVIPAMELRQKLNLDVELLTEEWERGRGADLWHNNRCNGLNKIGYQRSVFPVRFGKAGAESVYIVLNGYIPGLRSFFVDKHARLIAIHIITNEGWAKLRNQVAGGEADPRACERGSIRHDAARGLIPLDPNYVRAASEPVNGQRNVCHASATVFDAFFELIDWFEYRPEQTLVGKLLRVLKQDPREFMKHRVDSSLAWKEYRNASFPQLRDIEKQLVLEKLREHVSQTSWYNAMGGDRQVDENKLRHARGAEDYMENLHRLVVGGHDFFVDQLSMIVADAAPDPHIVLDDICHVVRHLDSSRLDPGVLATAYRVVAGDLIWMCRPTFREEVSQASHTPGVSQCAHSSLFRARLLAELPEQAFDIARRIRENIVSDACAMAPASRQYRSSPLKTNQSWSEYVNSATALAAPPGDVIGLVLCGGRSTRMASTIPKAILPLRGRFLFDWTHSMIERAAKPSVIYAATGFRSELIKLAIADRAHLLHFAGLHGVGFRVATCLHSLRSFSGLVVLTYCDMPDVSSVPVSRLVERVKNDQRSFGILVSQTAHLSGHVAFHDGKIKSVIQQRLHPNDVPRSGYKDVGVYVFHNTEEFRRCLLEIENNNVRGEYMFADVVEQLAKAGWTICHEEEIEANTETANTSGDFLRLTAWSHCRSRSVQQCAQALEDGLGLKIEPTGTVEHLNADFEHWFGPVMLYPRWNSIWR